MRKPTHLTFKIKDSHGIAPDLHDVALLISGWSELLEKSLRTQVGAERLTADLRSKYPIRVSAVRPGSINIDTELLDRAMQMVLPTLGSFSPFEVIDRIKTVIDFCGLFEKSKKEEMGFSVTIQELSIGQLNINTGDGSINVTTSEDTIRSVGLLRPTLSKMSKPIQEGRVESFSIIQPNRPETTVDAENCNAFQNEFELLPDPIKFKAGIFRFNTRAFTGGLKVVESDDLPTGQEYSFELASKSAVLTMKAIDALKQPLVTVSCLREVVPSPTPAPTVVSLRLIAIS